MSRSRGRARDTAPEQDPAQSWDEFWGEVARDESDQVEYEMIRGVRTPVPRDMPMHLVHRAETLQAGEGASAGDIDGIRAMVAEIFGDEMFDQWIEAGMTMTEFQVVLAWGMASGTGTPITFRRAYEVVRDSGKSRGPNRSTRRASARSGGRSRPTSPASTGSTGARSGD